MRKAGDIISEIFRDRFGPGFLETARQGSGLFSSWSQIVTEAWPRSEDVPAVAAHSKIREFERGLLIVEADHPGWIQILQTKQAALLSAAQRKYPELDIRSIAFRLSRGPLAPSPALTAEAPEKKEDPEKNEVPEKNEGCARPRDEEFYAALKGLEKSMKKRNRLR